jgi:hypothetical protein
VGCVRGGVRPNKSNKDSFALPCVLGLKLAAPILELADLGRVHSAVLAVGPIESPLVGLGILQTEGQTFNMASFRAIGVELLQISAAIPNLSRNGSTVKFDPGRGAR